MKPFFSPHLVLALLATLWLGYGLGRGDYDPVVEDPHERDTEYPATMVEGPAGLLSHGARLNGILYLAAGKGPHPTVLLLHGLPGNERNTDLAHAIRRAGFNVAFLHYRGAWGSEGDFGFVNAVEDVEAMVAFLETEGARETYRVDRERLYLVGHSLGGGVALAAAARLPAVHGVVSIAGADLGLLADLPAETAAGLAAYLESELSLNVPDGLAALRMRADAAIDLHLPPHATVLAGRHLLFVTGRFDEAVDPELHQAPLLQALEAEGAESVATITLAADHGFSSRRIALARTVVDWLASR